MSTQDFSRIEKIKDRRVRRSITAIHNAFWELAAERNIEKITVAAIADRANINRKTFYLHYASIEALIEEMLYSEISDTSRRITEACIDGKGNLDVNAFFVTMGSEMIRSLSEHPEVYKHVDSKWIIDRVEPLLTEVIVKNDSLQLSDTLGPYLKYCVTFFCAGLLSTYHRWVDDESELPMEELSKHLGDAIRGSMLALANSTSTTIEPSIRPSEM